MTPAMDPAMDPASAAAHARSPRLRVLVTRPQPDADRLSAQLAERDMEGVVAPLMRIHPMDEAPDLSGVTGLLFTSANGARAFAERTAMPEAVRALPAFCVGPATADTARAAGFRRVEAADGDVTSLAALVVARVAGPVDPEAGILLHAAGRDRAGDLAGLLGAHGFRVRRAVLYRAEWVDVLPEAAHRALAGGRLDAATFFSPRTARAFVSLASGAGLAADCGKVVAVCLSEAIATRFRAAPDIAWRDIRVAARPVLSCLLDQLETVAVSTAPAPRHRDRSP